MKKYSLFISVFIVLFWSLASYAVEVECFGNTYIRGKGKPVTVTETVISAHQGDAKITIINGNPYDPKVKRITSMRAWLNGKLFCKPNDLNNNVSSLEMDVILEEGENTLEVKLAGPRRGRISIAVTHEVDAEAAAYIDLDGGTISTHDGFSMSIPDGALSSPTLISISQVEPGNEIMPGITNFFKCFELKPHGTSFEKPVGIQISYPDEDDDGFVDGTPFNEESLFAFITDEEGTGWIPMEITSQDFDENSITTTANHLSIVATTGNECVQPELDPNLEAEILRGLNIPGINTPSLNSSDVIVLKGEIANKIRLLDGDDLILTGMLWFALAYDGIINSFIANQGDLSKFIDDVVSIEGYLDSKLTSGTISLIDLILSLVNAVHVTNAIKDTQDDIYIALERYKTEQESISYYNGKVYILDDLCLDDTTNNFVKVEFTFLDEKKVNPCGCTLQQYKEGGLIEPDIPVPNCANRDLIGEPLFPDWRFSNCPEECDCVSISEDLCQQPHLPWPDSWSCPLNTYYLDQDLDEHGDPNSSIEDTHPPEGYVINNYDCNDEDETIYPGAPEICDGKDNQCEGYSGYGEIDEGCFVVYSQPIVDGVPVYNDSGIGAFADDFILSTDAAISSVSYWNTSTAESGFTVNLYEDNGFGQPETIPFVSFPLLNGTSVPTGILDISGDPVFKHELILPEVPVLHAGRTYYLSILQEGYTLWSGDGPGSFWVRGGIYPSWTNSAPGNPNNLAFELLRKP